MKISQIMGAHSAQKIQRVNSNSYVSRPNLVNKADSVSFSGQYVEKPVNVDLETAKFVANSLSTSTSGHRAVYGSDKFNKDIVELLTVGVAKYAKDQAKGQERNPVVMIGGDTRQATRESLPLIKEVLLGQNVDVLYIEKPVPTPLLALAAREHDVDLAILMTASHNPWADGGYNLVTKNGAIAPAEVTQEVAKKVVETAQKGSYTANKAATPAVVKFFPYEMYKNELDANKLINWDKIQKANIDVYYDALNGTGENVLPDLLNDYGIASTNVKSTGHEGPNPVAKNFGELSANVKDSEAALKIGLATDGDADRFGVVDENGEFMPANDVLLLAAYHLAKNKGLDGAIIRSQATSSQLDAVGQKYGQPIYETPVGFKYIAEDIMDLRKEGKDTLVSGEESGGMTVNGHIPEKDGILADLLILDLVATEGKPISRILKDVKDELGISQVAEVRSKRLNSEADKDIIMNRVKDMFEDVIDGEMTEFAGFEIDADRTMKHSESMLRYRKGGDGFKFFFTDGSNILIRKSGTEPLVKNYVEAYGKDLTEAAEKREKLKAEVDKIFTI